MSKLFLGVDGGGSKTELCVADGSGKTLLTLNGGATSFMSVGNAAVSVRNTFKEASGECPAAIRRRTGWSMRP